MEADDGTPTVSIVIRAYNERDPLERLLHGISRQTLKDVEVVLIDSDSTDGTLDVARNYGVDEIVQLPRDQFTYGRGLNCGCQVASGTYCVFASAHTFPLRTDWLETLIKPLETDCTALVYGSQRGGIDSPVSEKQVFRQWFPDHDIDVQPQPFCHNANAAIRRDTWTEFSYDESIGGLEDVDWATRVRKAGYEIAYAADATVVHIHHETPREIVKRYRRESRTLAELTGTSFGLWTALIWWWRAVRSDWQAATRRESRPATLGRIFRFRLCQALGMYRGFNSTTTTRETTVDDAAASDLLERYLDPSATESPVKVDYAEKTTDRGCRIRYTDLDAPSPRQPSTEPRPGADNSQTTRNPTANDD